MTKEGLLPWEATKRYNEIMSKPMFLVTDEELAELRNLVRIIKKPVL